MRKWIVSIFVAIAVVFGLLLWPCPESIEYHKAEYLAARKRPALGDWVRDGWNRLRGKPSRLHVMQWERQMKHERALIALGYLGERVFIVSNVAPSNLIVFVDRAVLKKGTNWDFYRFRSWTSGIALVTRKADMPTDEEVLREIEADAKTNR